MAVITDAAGNTVNTNGENNNWENGVIAGTSLGGIAAIKDQVGVVQSQLTSDNNASQAQLTAGISTVTAKQTADAASVQAQITALTGTNEQGLVTTLQNITDLGTAIDQSAGDVKQVIGDSTYKHLESINGLSSTITAASNQSQLQNLNSFNNLTTTLLTGINNIQVQNNTNLAQIIAGQTAQALAAAENSSQIRRDISEDGQKSRELINSLNVQNLERKLTDEKVSNALVRGELNQSQQTAAIIAAFRNASTTKTTT